MTDAHGIARVQLKSIVERVERLEAEIADLNADKSDIYKDARSNGFDVKAIKKVVSRRKLDDNKRVEEDAVFETYWDAIHGTGLVHAHARENIEQFDPITGELKDDNTVPEREQSRGNGQREHQHVHSRQTDAAADHGRQDGVAAATDHEGDAAADAHGIPETNSPETATTSGQTVPSPSQRAMTGDNLAVTAGETATHSPSDDDAIAAVNGKAGLANVIDVEPSSSGLSRSEAMDALIEASADELFPEIDPNEDRSEGQSLGGGLNAVGANLGGSHVTDSENAQPDKAGGLVCNPPANPLRPHCLRPENCGGYGSKHCFSCSRAAKANEDEEEAA